MSNSCPTSIHILPATPAMHPALHVCGVGLNPAYMHSVEDSAVTQRQIQQQLSMMADLKISTGQLGSLTSWLC